MPFLVTATIEEEMRFREYGQAVQQSLNKALAEAAVVMLDNVRRNETRIGTPNKNDKLPGVHVPEGVHLRDSFRAAPLKAKYLGMIGAVSSALIVVYSPNPNALWQEYGTRGGRRKALKPNKQGKRVNKQGNAHKTAGNTGVKPLAFMRRGMAQSMPEVARLVEDAILGAGEVLGASSLVDSSGPIETR